MFLACCGKKIMEFFYQHRIFAFVCAGIAMCAGQVHLASNKDTKASNYFFSINNIAANTCCFSYAACIWRIIQWKYAKESHSHRCIFLKMWAGISKQCIFGFSSIIQINKCKRDLCYNLCLYAINFLKNKIQQQLKQL